MVIASGTIIQMNRITTDGAVAMRPTVVICRVAMSALRVLPSRFRQGATRQGEPGGGG